MAGFILFSREDSCIISVCEFTTNRLRDLKKYRAQVSQSARSEKLIANLQYNRAREEFLSHWITTITRLWLFYRRWSCFEVHNHTYYTTFSFSKNSCSASLLILARRKSRQARTSFMNKTFSIGLYVLISLMPNEAVFTLGT